MRQTQFIGLNEKARSYIMSHAHLTSQNTLLTHPLKIITGMFDEPIYELKQYVDKDTGRHFEEYIQAEPWSSGPMIFLALKDENGPIQESLWEDKEIDI